MTEQLTYSDYLALDDLLGAQHLRSSPPHHDELLFIIQHQTSELWLKLMLHELRSARDALREDDLHTALKRTARVKQIQFSMTEQWSVLATLTPSEYVQFRRFLATSSGFQSYQYRAVEFLLGNKNPKMLDVFDAHPEARAMLDELLHEPSLYDEFLRLLARAGFDIPTSVMERDVSAAWAFTPELVPVLLSIYQAPAEHWRFYEACEELVDLEDNFQLWRFRHLRTVQRTIGMKTGTGGTAGVAFLERALSQTFFPELYAVRNEISD
ncbi:MAG TPA: tryptophan 2,3-dioxygenase family protein [Galbitalea sp.]|jgi:tryptophan 2,3-dioxygenase